MAPRAPTAVTAPRGSKLRVAAARLVARAGLVALGALAGLGACGRDPTAAPPCGAVAARFMFLAEQDLEQTSVDEATRRAVRAQLPAMRDSLAAACSDTQWSDGVRRCLHAAADHAAFEACQRDLTEAQRRALDVAARGGADPR